MGNLAPMTIEDNSREAHTRCKPLKNMPRTDLVAFKVFDRDPIEFWLQRLI